MKGVCLFSLAALVRATDTLPKGVVSGEAWVCEDVEQIKKDEGIEAVNKFVESHGLGKAYTQLKEEVKTSKVTTFAAESSFVEKGVRTMLLSEGRLFWKRSKICFVETGHINSVPQELLSERICDGCMVQTCSGRVKNIPYGVAAAELKGQKRHLEYSDEVTKMMGDLHLSDPREVYAMFTTVMFAKPSNVPREVWDALVTGAFKKSFRKEGVGLFLAKEDCSKMMGMRTSSTWLEFADLSVDPKYVPREVYRRDPEVLRFAMCFEQKDEVQTYNVRALAWDAGLATAWPSEGCGRALGAVENGAYPACTCKSGEKLFCMGGKGVHTLSGVKAFGQTFNIANFITGVCWGGKMYCARLEQECHPLTSTDAQDSEW